MSRLRWLLPLVVSCLVLSLSPVSADVIVDGSDGQAALSPPDCSGLSSADTSIQEAVTSTTNGDTVWVCPHTYDEVVLVDTPNVTIRSAPSGDSTNVVVRAPNGASALGIPALAFFQDNARVLGMRFRNGWEGVRFQGVTGGLLRDTRADSNVTDGVFITNSSNLRIDGSLFDDNDLNGANVSTSNSNVLFGNQASGNASAGIRLFDATDNRLEANRTILNATDGVALAGVSTGNLLEANRIRNNGFDGVFVTDSASSNTLEDNRTVLNGRHGFVLNGVDSNTVRSSVADTNTVHGLSITGGSGHSVKSNQVRDNGDHGVSLTSSTDNDIRGNELHSNGNANIHLSGSANNAIAANILRDGAGTDDNGILLEASSSGNGLNGNRIELHDSAGVKVVNSVSNTLQDNIVDTNTFGVWLHNADDHRLESNRIRDNDTGIVVSGTASDSEISNVAQLNIIAGNGQGVVNSTVRIFDARRVYWGASTGPSGGNTDPFTGATAGGGGDEIASPGVPDTNVAFDPFLTTTNITGGGGAGASEECLVERLSGSGSLTERLRASRDRLLEGRLGRWMTRQYYRVSAVLVPRDAESALVSTQRAAHNAR